MTLTSAISQDHGVRTLGVAGLTFELCAPRELLPGVDDALGHLTRTGQRGSISFSVSRHGAQIHLARFERRAWACAEEAFIPLLKAQLLDEVLEHAPYELALHAGAYAYENGLLLLVGSPGAGKTTLGLALVRSGFDLAADDVVLMHRDGSVTGLPFAPAVKPGALHLVASYWPTAADAAVHVRPDGVSVRYLRPARIEAQRPGRIGAIALLDRRSSAQARVVEADPVCVLEALLAEAFARDERLTARAFLALHASISEARCCTLTYSDLADAAVLLKEFCK